MYDYVFPANEYIYKIDPKTIKKPQISWKKTFIYTPYHNFNLFHLRLFLSAYVMSYK